jgi:hypothetical protein
MINNFDLPTAMKTSNTCWVTRLLLPMRDCSVSQAPKIYVFSRGAQLAVRPYCVLHPKCIQRRIANSPS